VLFETWKADGTMKGTGGTPAFHLPREHRRKAEAAIRVTAPSFPDPILDEAVAKIKVGRK
jgi:hypothetical protein